MADNDLIPAAELAAKNKAHFPNESPEYRRARNALLAEEIELRRHIESVANLRRALPPGGVVPEDYAFEGSNGAVRLSQLFGGKDTLVLYSMMFGPQRERPAPCVQPCSHPGTGLPETFANVLLSQSPRALRSSAFSISKRNVGGGTYRFTPTRQGDYTRAYVSANDDDIPGLSVFTRSDGTIRHFWSGEMSGEMADPGQDPRGATDLDPLWTILDLTPAGRGADWYPKLEYAELTSDQVGSEDSVDAVAR